MRITLARLVEPAVLVSALLIAWLMFDLRVQQSKLEGDERVHVVLTDQLARGTYSLRGTPVLQLRGFSRYLYDRAVHYNPPLYNAVLLAIRELFGRTSYAHLSVFASGLSAYLVFRLTRRHASWAAALFAMFVFLGCPIVYLVSTRIWAEALLGLVILLAVASCERNGGRAPLIAAGVSLAAAAAIKTSVLFALPGFLWFAYRDRARAIVIVGVPVIVSALWLGYVHYADGAQPPVPAPVDDRLTNAFVAAQASKPAFSLFYLPFLLNPGYALALLSIHRARDAAPYALCVFGVMLAFSLLAWIGQGTYHTKYLGCVLGLLAVLAGLGFDSLGARMSVVARNSVRCAVALVVVAVLLLENSVHRQVRLAEVDPALYTAPPP